MTVRGTRRCPTDTLHPASADHHWVGVEVELEGTSRERVPANPFYASLVDDQGRQFASEPGPCLPGLRHAPLGAGEVARGWVSFLVPDQTAGLELRYAPRLPRAADEELTFKLGS